MIRLGILIFVLTAVGFTAGGCSANKPAKDHVPGAAAPEPREGDHAGRGVITKINTELGSIELDHEDMPGLMPAMRMEFYVSDKALLRGLAVGDSVDFTILYKGGTETITKLTRSER